MALDNPVVILYDANGNPLAVQDGVVIPVDTSALLIAGADHTGTAKYLAVDPSGRAMVGGPTPIFEPPDANPFVVAGINDDGVVQTPPFHILAGGYGGGFGTVSNVLTDLESYRDDFSGTSLNVPLTGLCTFNNGDPIITGNGTIFFDEVWTVDSYIKNVADPDSDFVKIKSIDSETQITLDSPYNGTSGIDVPAVWTLWNRDYGVNGAIDKGVFPAGTSEVAISSGTVGGDLVWMHHGTYCAPVTFTFYAKLSQRIDNQEAFIGIVDDPSNPASFTLVIFNSHDNTKVKLRTASDIGNVEESVATTLPGGATTDSYQRYRLVTSNDCVTLYCNDLLVIRNRLHLPLLYNNVPFTIGWHNTNVPNTNSILYIDALGVVNHDVVEVETATTNTPQLSQIVGVDAAGNLQQTAVDFGGLHVHPFCTNSSNSVVGSNINSVTLLNANNFRLGATVFNNSNQYLYLKLGLGSSNTSFTKRLGDHEYYELPFGYAGIVTGSWAGVNGDAQITEFTA